MKCDKCGWEIDSNLGMGISLDQSEHYCVTCAKKPFLKDEKGQRISPFERLWRNRAKEKP